MSLAQAFYAAQLRRLRPLRHRSPRLAPLRRAPIFEALEPRLLLSADNELLGPLAANVIAAELASVTVEAPPPPGAPSGTEAVGAIRTVSIPTTLAGNQGDPITVPINIDDGSGVESVDVQLNYDPNVLTLGPVRRGAVITDASASPLVNNNATTGVAIIGMPVTVPNGSTAAGSVLLLDFTIKATAPNGASLLNLVSVSLNEGGLAVSPVSVLDANTGTPAIDADATDGSLQVPVGGTIQGVKFNDLDNDGVRDGGEDGLQNWTIFLDADGDGVFDGNEASRTTAADGSYSFTGLAAGTYRVGEVAQAGWRRTTTDFAAILSGANETPPIGSTATGAANLSLTESNNLLMFGVTFSGLSGTSSGLHIHQGAPGVPGGIVHDLVTAAGAPSSGFNSPLSGVVTLTSAQVTQLLAGNLYVNLHSSTFSGGEIRGQIMPGVAVTLSAGVTATVDVGNHQNQPPSALGDVYITPQDTALVIGAPGVLGNDTDPEGDPISAVFVSGPAHGTLTLNPGGGFTYTPASGFSGTDGFVYRATDSITPSVDMTVTIGVNQVPHAPVAGNDSYTTAEDTPLTIAAAGVLANDTDQDNDPLTAVSVSGPTHGTLTLNGDGGFTYTPAANFFGPDSFTYRATDASFQSDPATVTLTVTPVADAPAGQADSYSTAHDTPLSVSAPGVLSNDTDVDGDALTAIIAAGPAHGSVALNANGSFTYTPAAGYNGPDSFSYRASDGTLQSDPATTVNLTITGPVSGVAMSIPTDLQGRPGDTVHAPVNISNSAGVESADIEVRYDPAIFNVAAVTRGALVTDPSASLLANIDEVAGTVTIGLASPVALGAGSGSLIVIDFMIEAGAAPGTHRIDLASASLNEHGIVVSPAPVVGVDGTDGLVDVVTGPTFVDARIGNRIDLDADGFAQRLDVEFKVDNTSGPAEYYVVVYEDDGSPDDDDFLGASAVFAASATDYHGVTVFGDFFTDEDQDGTPQSMAEFRLELYDIDDMLVQTWRAADDPDLTGVQVEPGFDDGFAPYFFDAQITNLIDADDDGAVGQFTLEFDVDSDVAGDYYVRVYEDDGDPAQDDFLVQSATFAVDGFVEDYRGVAISAANHPGADLLDGTAQFRLDLFAVGTGGAPDRLVQTWRASDDIDLADLPVESVDPPHLHFFDVRRANEIDLDGDGHARQFDVEFDVDVPNPTSYYVAVYAEGLLLLYSDTFPVEGDVEDYQSVTIVTDHFADVLDFAVVNLSLELYDAGTDTLEDSWDLVSDEDLGAVPVELSSDDGLFFFDAVVTNVVDADGDGRIRLFDLEIDVDSDIARDFRVAVYIDKSPGQADLLTLTSPVFTTDGGVEDFHLLGTLSGETFLGTAPAGDVSLRLDLIDVASGEVIQTWRAADDFDLGDLPLENAIDDSVPVFTDADVISTDRDGDGKARAVEIQFTVVWLKGGAAYVEIYEHDDLVNDDLLLGVPDPSMVPRQFLMLTAGVPHTFSETIDETDSDFHHLIDDDDPTGAPGVADFRLVLLDAEGTPTDARGPADDPDLDNVLVELSIEDPAARIVDVTIPRRVDNDIDGFAHEMDLAIALDSSVAGRGFLKIFANDQLLRETGGFAINGPGTRTETFPVLPSHRLADFRVELWLTEENGAPVMIPVGSRGPAEDPDLNDVGVELLEEDVPPTLQVTSFTPTPSGFIARLSGAIDASSLNLYEAQSSPGPFGPADMTIVGQTGGAVHGTLVVDATGTLTFVKTGGPLEPDTYTVTLRSAANAFKGVDGALLDGDANATAGGDHVRSFIVAPLPSVIVSLADFARGPGQPVNVPAHVIGTNTASTGGIPIRVSNMAAVESIAIELRYNPDLLTITSVERGSSLPGDAQVVGNATTPGRVVIGVSIPTPLTGGALDAVVLRAQVPANAASLYRDKHVLDITSLRINDGAIGSLADDAVHVNAYVGDTQSNGEYTPLDAQRVLRTFVELDSGFAHYPLVDPIVIGDVALNAEITPLDATRILQEFVELDRAEIPPLTGLAVTAILGPDPMVTIPTNLSGQLGSPTPIPVPVNIDDAFAVESVALDVQFDSEVLEFVVGGVRRGTAITDPSATPIANIIGSDPRYKTIRIGMPVTFAETDHGGGSLVTIDFRIKAGAAEGPTLINLVSARLTDGAQVINPLPIADRNQADPTDGILTVLTLPEISGVKFNDLDNDGVRDANEPGLGGWTIFLDANVNGVLDGTEDFRVTSSDSGSLGAYSFAGLASGTYRVAEVGQAGWRQTTPVFAGSVTSRVTVDIGNHENLAPTAMGDSYPVAPGLLLEGSSLIVAAAGVLTNDTDPEHDPLTTVLVANAMHGTLDLRPDGSFTYTPATNSTGEDRFTYKANDGNARNADSNVATVTLTVTPVNDAPEFDAIADQGVAPNALVLEDAGLRSVAITGIRPGPVDATDEAGQTVMVTAAANVEGIVEDLQIAGAGESRTLTYRPVANMSGDVVIIVTAEDNGDTANGGQKAFSRQFTIRVTAVNDAPEFDAIADQGIAPNPLVLEDAGLQSVAIMGVRPGPVGATDEAEQTVTLTATTNVAGIVEDLQIAGSGDSRTLAYRPVANMSGGVVVTVTAQDSGDTANGGQKSFSRQFTIRVTAVNDAPAAVNDVATAPEDTPIPVTVVSNDTDVDDANSALTAVLVQEPAHGAVALSTDGRTFTYTPNQDYVGPDGFTYRASDGQAQSDNVATVSLTVTPVNDAPVGVSNSYTTAEDTVLIVAAVNGVLKNDTDVDGDQLTAQRPVPVVGPSHGTLALNPDGSFTYTPGENFHGLDSFRYLASDGSLSSEPTTVFIDVTPVNDPPTVVDPIDDVVVAPGAPDTVINLSPVFADVDIATNTPPDALGFALIENTNPALVTATLSGSTLTLHYQEGQLGSALIRMQASDVAGATAADDFTVTVAGGRIEGMKFNDLDNDGLKDAGEGGLSGFTLSIFRDANGNGLADPGEFAATTTTGTAGSYAFINLAPGQYRLREDLSNQPGFRQTAPAGGVHVVQLIFTETVTGVDFGNHLNVAPVADADSFDLDEDQVLTVAGPGVLDGDTDFENDSLTAVLVTPPSHAAAGGFILHPNGGFTYRPALNFNGQDRFTYKANDGGLESAVGTVTLNVRPVNDPPTVTPINDVTVNEDAADTTINLALAFADVDILTDTPPDALTFAVVQNTNPTMVASSLSGSMLTLDYLLNQNGSASITVRATDRAGAPVDDTFVVHVNPVNDAPVAVAEPETYMVVEDTPRAVAAAQGVLANDTDVDGPGPLTAVLVSGPAHALAGSFGLNPDGSFAYTGARDYTGPDSFTYRANDGGAQNSLSNVVTVTLDVTARNDAPVAVPDLYGTPRDTVLTRTAAGGVLANDTDVDGPLPLTVELVSGPTRALQFQFNPNGSFTYTPIPLVGTEQHYEDTFTYKVADGLSLAGNTATVTIQVGFVNPPVITLPIGDKEVDEGLLLDFTVGVTDADGPADHSTFALFNVVNATQPLDAPGNLVTAPAGAAIDATTGRFTWQPAEEQGFATYHLAVKATDSIGLTDVEAFTVTVNEVIEGTGARDVITVSQSGSIVTALVNSRLQRFTTAPPKLTINGLLGNDVITLRGLKSSIVIVNAGAGNDSVNGLGVTATALHVFAGDGNDTVRGGRGNDVIDAGAGNDLVYGGPGNDSIMGGDGNDNLNGEAGNDSLFGGAGEDILSGGLGNDLLEGGDGDDRILGGAGNDEIYGGTGDDRLLGEAGNDSLFGGPGTDIVVVGAGRNQIAEQDGPAARPPASPPAQMASTVQILWGGTTKASTSATTATSSSGTGGGIVPSLVPFTLTPELDRPLDLSRIDWGTNA